MSALCSEEEGVGFLPKVGRNCHETVMFLMLQMVAKCV